MSDGGRLVLPLLSMWQVGNGADEFLHDRKNRLQNVRACQVRQAMTSKYRDERPIVDHAEESESQRGHGDTPEQAPMWRVEDFVPGHLGFHAQFWEEEILTVCDEAEKAKFLGWIKGVDILDFIDEKAEGIFQGRKFTGAELTSVELPNHVPPEFDEFVSTQLDKYLKSGVVVAWESVADIAQHPRPHMVMPLGVEESKPRAFLDARWLNLMCAKFPFKIDAVGKVAQCAWPGAFQMTCDHKSGFHHVPLAKGSWQYFGFEWKGKYYVFTTLCFGWCASPYVYHSLSDVVARYVRTKGIPMLTWIDDFYFTNPRSTRTLDAAQQRKAAGRAAFFVMRTFYKAGYFMSIEKCELHAKTRLIFLGVVCDSVEEKFFIPEDKLAKLERIITDALDTGSITFQMLEKVAGKCTSMSVACPAAALYTHHMYQNIASFQKTGGRKQNTNISFAKNSGLCFELTKWLEVRERMNGAAWYRALHQRLTIVGASDASKSGYGGIVRCPGEDVFRVAGDFPDEWVQRHINEQEAYALKELLVLFCRERPTQVQGSTLVMDVDNSALFYGAKKGRSSNTCIHEIITELFWLQVASDFLLKVQWVSTKANAEADDLSRPDADAYVRLERTKFEELCRFVRKPFDMDLMATPASAQSLPGSRAPLPFISRFHTEGCAAVDVLSQDLRCMPGSDTECFGFCFPPTNMVGVVLQRMAECRAKAVVVVPEVQQTWYPMLVEATVQSWRLADVGEDRVFFRMNHQLGKRSFAYRKWAMIAVEVDFRAK